MLISTKVLQLIAGLKSQSMNLELVENVAGQMEGYTQEEIIQTLVLLQCAAISRQVMQDVEDRLALRNSSGAV